MGKRLSITLTDTQAKALDALAAESGASLQSMVGLAVSSWLRGQETPDRRRPYDRYELLERLGIYASDYDIPAIERDATAYDTKRDRMVWAVDESELSAILARHNLRRREQANAAVVERKPYERHELLAFLGNSANDFDVDAIERDATEYDAKTGRTVWAVDHDELAEICARHDRSIKRSVILFHREVVERPQAEDTRDENEGEDEGAPYCEVCGRPAMWFSIDDEGVTHYKCDEH